MPMPDVLSDPEHWRERAEESRVIADLLSDAKARAILIEIAAGYERLAQNAEQRASRLKR